MKHIRSNHPRIRRLFLITLAALIFVFLLRWSYELVFTNNDIIVSAPHFGTGFSGVPYGRQFFNIATDKITQMDITGNTIVIDQKYEKTANLSSVTHRFDEDHQRLRGLINDHDAIVQTENLQGLAGNQTLTMTIGVTPQQFDDMVNSLRELGTLQSFVVNQVDKTNEFNMLLAQQEVLRTTRDSYASLQELGGSIQDMLLLQERILVVERDLQHLGVDLGVFATEHSFCTINFTLREHEAPSVSIRFLLNAALTSFWWTLGAAAIIAFAILSLLVAVTLGLWLHINIRKQMQGPVSEDLGSEDFVPEDTESEEAETEDTDKFTT